MEQDLIASYSTASGHLGIRLHNVTKCPFEPSFGYDISNSVTNSTLDKSDTTFVAYWNSISFPFRKS